MLLLLLLQIRAREFKLQRKVDMIKTIQIMVNERNRLAFGLLCCAGATQPCLLEGRTLQ